MFASFIFVLTVSSLTFARVDAQIIANTSRDPRANNCLLPPYPEHGRYTVSRNPSATPGERYPAVMLDISCDPGYLIKNSNDSIFCVNGYWSETMPTCDFLGFCTLPTNDLRVEYRCASASGSLESSQECKSPVPSGAVVTPICKSPAYFSLDILSDMHCRDGMWDYNPICKPACGVTTQHRQLEGSSITHLELPWHAVIYEKGSKPYNQICGGSLITANKIISAANCFYDYTGALIPASNFVVAVNKMYRPYKDPRDKNSQYSDVVDIKIPSSYRGKATYYEDNIAILIVEKSFFFHLSVQPVCLDFDKNLDIIQLTNGNSGKTVLWSIADYNNQSSEVLNVVDFSYLKSEECDNILSTSDLLYLTKDKFCARYNNGTWIYTGNIGSGLAFLDSTTQRYYLRGVLSLYHTVTEDNTTIYPYTSIIKHESFLNNTCNKF